jgi:dihydrolipoamide dehydrogenase
VQRGELALKTDKGVKVRIIQGYASFESEHQLFVDFSANSDDPYQRPPPGDRLTGERMSFGAAVIAAGTSVFVPSIPGAREALASGGVLTSDFIWSLLARPRQLAIIGAGAVGVEMAQIFQDFGAKVTLIEAQPRILAEVDREVATNLAAMLGARPNLTLHTSVKVEKISGQPGNMRLNLSDNEGKQHTVKAEYVLIATGKRQELERLNLAAAGVEANDGVIKTDSHGRMSSAA